MSVLLGAELAALRAANLAAISSRLATIPGGTLLTCRPLLTSRPFLTCRPQMGRCKMVEQEVAVPTFRMGINPVTNEEYAHFVQMLGPRRYVLSSFHPGTGVETVFAVGKNPEELSRALHKASLLELFPDEGDRLLFGGLKAFVQSVRRTYVSDSKPPQGFGRPGQPVVEVNWFSAFVFAYLHGGHLPTDEQWEYAARVIPGSALLREVPTPSGRLTREEVHYDADATIDVDDPRYPTLENGLRHLAGNVWEWTRKEPYGFKPWEPKRSLNRNVPENQRGGSWAEADPKYFQATFRQKAHPDGRPSSMEGFRMAAPAP